MFIDPQIIQYGFFGLATLCGFMIGRNFGFMSREQIIENTIDWMIENNLCKARINSEGEQELISLDEK